MALKLGKFQWLWSPTASPTLLDVLFRHEATAVWIRMDPVQFWGGQRCYLQGLPSMDNKSVPHTAIYCHSGISSYDMS